MQKASFSFELKNKPASHEKAASVNEIISLIGETREYNYTYWLHHVGSVPFSKILEIVKKARELPKQYNKGGFITNQLCSSNKSKVSETKD